MEKTLIVIVGPTAIGKTAYAIDVARHYATEIVSCDSRQCYRELNIGVARPSREELQAVPHHFIANKSVTEGYNVYTYEQEALMCLKQLFIHHDVVVAVGGSGLYVDALCRGIALLPDPPQQLRDALSQQLKTEGLAPLQEKLKQLDPTYYNIVDKKNPIRLQRALEVCLTTGHPYSELIQQKIEPRPFRIIKVGLQCDKTTLRERIDSRADKMMQDGLLEEVKALHPLRHLQTLNTVGYKELFTYMDGTTSLEQAITEIKLHTWHYAKKQISYFARDKEIIWQDSRTDTHFRL